MENPSAAAYLAAAMDVARTACETQIPVIQAAARSICDSLESGRQLWVFGCGHSHMLAEELWGRAGGLPEVNAILEPSLMLHEGLLKSSLLERQAGLAAVLLDVHPVAEGDSLVIVSNSGRNSVPVEMAAIAKGRGAAVIALTSRTHSLAVEPRSPCGRRLLDLADVVIDNGGKPGDAVVPYRDAAVGATSTVVGALLLQAVAVEVVGEMDRRGKPLDPLLSLNL